MQTIVATFNDTRTAQTAMDRLLAQGFRPANVHLQSASTAGGTASGRTETGSTLTGGAYTDSTLRGGTGAGTATEPRGPLESVKHFFSTLFDGGSDDDAGTYAEAVRRGSAVLSVDASTDDELEKARSLISDLNPIDINDRAEQWKSQGWAGFDPNAKLMSQDEADFERQSVPVVQEELVVGKRTIDVGGLRVVKRMSETPVSQIVNLREERATIERRPVDRAATEADFANFKDGTIEVRETAEEAVVGKTARVVEEVSIGKTASERAETVSDSVRRTDVEVERIPGGNARGSETSAGNMARNTASDLKSSENARGSRGTGSTGSSLDDDMTTDDDTMTPPRPGMTR